MTQLNDFESRDFIEQVSILSAVAQEKNYESIPGIIRLMDSISKHDAIGLVIRDTLKTLLSGSEEQTVRFLTSENREVQRICIEVAGQKKIVPAIKPLTEMALQADVKKEYGILFTLVSALTQIHPSESLELFRKCMDHEDPLIASQCIDMLGTLQDLRSFGRLCDIISGQDLGDGDCDLPTASAIKALGRFRNQDSITFLVSMLHHHNPAVRRLIHQELAGFGAEAVEPLASVFQKESVDDKIFAANILGVVGTKEAGDVLVKALDKGLATHPNIRFAIYDALGRTPGITSLVCLVDALEEKDQMVLMAAVSSLGMHMNQWILDKIAETVRKGPGQGATLIKSIVASGALNIFEGLYLADENIAKMLMDEIRSSGDGELVSLYHEKLGSMDSEKAKADMQTLEAGSGKTGGPHILAVDDSKAMLNFYRSAAAAMGLSISTALNGKEALDILAGKDKFSLILTDLNMPVMDGIEFTRQVRYNPDYSGTPIIMITTESESSQQKLAKKVGVNSFLCKPFSSEKLQEAIKTHL